MKFQILSDLHTEFYKGNPPFVMKVPEADALILAGDICKASSISSVLPFFQDVNAKFQNTYYVMGNHEHYSNSFQSTFNKVQNFLEVNKLLNIHLLKAGMVEYLEDLVIVGDTLWTDCNHNDPVTKAVLQSGMSDYSVIKIGSNYRKLNPDDTSKAHKEALIHLRSDLGRNYDKKIVLITHHAMSKQSVHEKYRFEYYMNGGFHSELDQLFSEFPNIALAVHGHMHDSFDYKIGNTRCVANPRGYPVSRTPTGYIFENRNFKQGLVIDV